MLVLEVLKNSEKLFSVSLCSLIANLILLAPVGALLAESATESTSETDLARIVRSYSDSYVEVTASRNLKLRGELKRAIADVRRELSGLADRQAAATWIRFLALDSLDQLAETEHPSTGTLELIERRFYRAQSGLERRPMLRLRESIGSYVEFLQATGTPDVADRFRYHVEAIALQLESKQPASEQIGTHVAWLEAAGQTPDLVRAVRRHFRHPNLMVHVPYETVLSNLGGWKKSISKSKYSSHQIVGAQVSGFEHTTAHIQARLLKYEPRATIEVQLNGRAHSPSKVAAKGPVRIHSSGVTDLHATKRIYWDGRRVVAMPAVAHARVHSQTRGVDVERQRVFALSKGGFIDQAVASAARDQADQSRLQAELEAAAIAERELRREFDSSVAQGLEPINREIEEYFNRPLLRIGMFPNIQAVTDSRAIRIDFTKPAIGNLGAASLPPSKYPRDSVVLQMHESAFGAYIRRYAGGADWDDSFFSYIQQQVIGDTSYEFRIGLHDRWKLRWDRERPMSVRFDNDVVVFQSNVTHLTIGGKSYYIPFQVDCSYKVKLTASAPVFVRQGGPVIHWDENAKLDKKTKRYLTDFIRKKFGGFYMDEFAMDGLAAPAGGQWGGVSDLRVDELLIDDGWFTVIFRDRAVSDESTDDILVVAP